VSRACSSRIVFNVLAVFTRQHSSFPCHRTCGHRLCGCTLVHRCQGESVDTKCCWVPVGLVVSAVRASRWRRPSRTVKCYSTRTRSWLVRYVRRLPVAPGRPMRLIFTEAQACATSEHALAACRHQSGPDAVAVTAVTHCTTLPPKPSRRALWSDAATVPRVDAGRRMRCSHVARSIRHGRSSSLQNHSGSRSLAPR
jgi:hypothetical protein